MRNTWITKISSLLVAVVYLVAVFGFDVHVCGDSDQVYIGPLFAGISCENIHPDVVCHHHHHCCCHHCSDQSHHDSETCGADDDCQDNVNYLSLTGDDGHDYVVEMPVLAASVQLFLPACETLCMAGARCADARVNAPPRQYLQKITVLRV